jgi:hypothetical protein
MRRRLALPIALALLAAVVLAPAAGARQSIKKAVWGPVRNSNGASEFPVYRDLGAGIYQMAIRWDQIAPTRPGRATDPADPAYHWPPEVDDAIREARRYGMRVALMLIGAPPWANGGHSWNWAPSPGHFAAYARAAARRYPGVHLWLIWGEPTRAANFKPLPLARGGLTLSARTAAAPRRYARLLDAAYGALKSVSRANLVIGGCTFTSGDVTAWQWIRYMTLPGGRRPRLDMYAHNPFTAREPDTRNPPSPEFAADFSDLGRLARWLDRWFPRRRGRELPLFLSEWVIPTDRADRRFNFYTTRSVQAFWIRQALGIVRGWRRIYTLGWETVRDDPSQRITAGLLDGLGRRKAGYIQFKLG